MQQSKLQQPGFDPELPNANAVMAAICCVSSQYAANPSPELAKLAMELAHKLSAPQYAESKLVTEVAKRLANQWDLILKNLQGDLMSLMPTHSAVH